MFDLLVAVFFAVLIAVALLLLVWGLLALAGALAGIEILNGLLLRLGFSRPSTEGHTPGQVHSAEVSTAFRPNPERACAEGTVLLHGEIWNADCPEALAATLRPGTIVKVRYGIDLRVQVVEDGA